MSDNHHWPAPIQDVRRAARRASVAEVQRKNGPHPQPSEESSFSWPETIGCDRSVAIPRSQDFPITLEG